MGFIEKIQNKPQAEKFRIMWTVAIIVVIILVAVWVISAHFNKDVPKDTTLFQTLGQGVKNIGNSLKK